MRTVSSTADLVSSESSRWVGAAVTVDGRDVWLKSDVTLLRQETFSLDSSGSLVQDVTTTTDGGEPVSHTTVTYHR